MTAEIISIGDELLIGQILNSNQAYIAERLNSIGVFADRMTTVGDVEEEILKAFEHALASHNVVTVTGGLGPTHDDVTRACVCKFFHTGLVLDRDALENVRTFFSRRNITPQKVNEDQALVPSGCTVIRNQRGTAPGYLFERSGKYFFVMPGVPHEMKGMMEEFVLPMLVKRAAGSVILHRMLRTTGIAESFLAGRIGDVHQLFPRDSGATLAFLPNPRGVVLRITVKAQSALEAEGRIKSIEERIREKVEKYIYAAGNKELEEVVGKLLDERGFTISIAESCTGGLIADRLTNISGSSKYFERGVIAYSNHSKIHELGVPPALIQEHGAVSRQVAEAMAAGIRAKANTDIGVSTTGIAGPTGGSVEKPVGLVWIGYADKSETCALQFNFGGDRRIVKERTAQAAMELVRRKILKLIL
jgi:nicotinamide-nucleotide amidase